MISFVFSIIFFNESKVNEGSYYIIWLICALCIIIPSIGILLGGFITHYMSRFNSLVANCILMLLALLFCFLLFFMEKLTFLFHNIFLGLMLLFQMSSIPLCLNAINQFRISIESKQYSFKIITFTSSFFGLFCGGIIGHLFKEYKNDIIFYFTVVSFVFCLLFSFEYYFYYKNNKLNDAHLHKYQIFLILANTFGKIALFVWNDYDGDSLVTDNNKEHQAIEFNNISLDSQLEIEKSETLTNFTTDPEIDTLNRLSNITFQNNRSSYRSSKIKQAQRFTFN